MKKGGKGGGAGDREEETTSQAANMGKTSIESSGLQHGGGVDGGLDVDPRVELHFQALILQEPPPPPAFFPVPHDLCFPLSRSPGHLNLQRRLFQTPAPHHGLTQPPVREEHLQPQFGGGSEERKGCLWLTCSQHFKIKPSPDLLSEAHSFLFWSAREKETEWRVMEKAD